MLRGRHGDAFCELVLARSMSRMEQETAFLLKYNLSCCCAASRNRLVQAWQQSYLADALGVGQRLNGYLRLFHCSGHQMDIKKVRRLLLDRAFGFGVKQLI
jgi:hypothetical protein